MRVCNDLHAIHGVVWHCDQTPGHNGDHAATHYRVTWPQHADTGARWTIRHPGGFLWHRIETSTRTACGSDIKDLTPATVRGRTLSKPPVEGLVCPCCLSVAPWVAVPAGTAVAA